MGLRRTWLGVACVLTLGLSACGSSSNTTTTTSASASSASSPAVALTKPHKVQPLLSPTQVKTLTSCMSAHGDTAAAHPSETTVRAAQKACAQYLPKLTTTPVVVHPVSASVQALQRSDLGAAAGCMHAHGAKLASTLPANAPAAAVEFAQTVALHAAELSPASEAAVQACQKAISAFNAATTAVTAPTGATTP